jgi:hypothetical protein
MTWDAPLVAELRGLAHSTLGAEVADETLTQGIHVAVAALHEMETGGPGTPEQAETTLRALWGSDYDDRLDAASEAWEALTKAVRASLTESGVRYSVSFVSYMSDVGRKLSTRRAA